MFHQRQSLYVFKNSPYPFCHCNLPWKKQDPQPSIQFGLIHWLGPSSLYPNLALYIHVTDNFAFSDQDSHEEFYSLLLHLCTPSYFKWGILWGFDTILH
jgi:hypothetical protein